MSSTSFGGFHGFLASCYRLLDRGGGGLRLQLFDRNLSAPDAEGRCQARARAGSQSPAKLFGCPYLGLKMPLNRPGERFEILQTFVVKGRQ